jgi:hypothetical protein
MQVPKCSCPTLLAAAVSCSTHLNEGWAYEEGGQRYGDTGELGTTGITFCNWRVTGSSNVNIKALDVLYKSISAFNF